MRSRCVTGDEEVETKEKSSCVRLFLRALRLPQPGIGRYLTKPNAD